jgi:hypothetical protein
MFKSINSSSDGVITWPEFKHSIRDVLVEEVKSTKDIKRLFYLFTN